MQRAVLLQIHKDTRNSGQKSRGALFSVMKFVLRLLFRTTVFLFLLSIAAVMVLKWIDPPFSSFMVQERIRRLTHGEGRAAIHYKWVPIERISPHMALAAIAAEDQNFALHHGFDFGAIRKAIEHNQSSNRLHGASTISQQVVKNLFLWPERSFFRKALEAYFTLLVETLWSKKRILEMYLNTVQWGKGIYGVETASLVYFRNSARDLNVDQSALLAAVLPNPVKYSARSPSAYILQRKTWILRQMRQLGVRTLDAL